MMNKASYCREQISGRNQNTEVSGRHTPSRFHHYIMNRLAPKSLRSGAPLLWRFKRSRQVDETLQKRCEIARSLHYKSGLTDYTNLHNETLYN